MSRGSSNLDHELICHSTLIYVPLLASTINISHHGSPLSKGQIISKWFFGVLYFLQKTNKNKSTWGIIVVKLNSFVCIWRKSRHQKPFRNYLTFKMAIFGKNWVSVVMYLVQIKNLCVLTCSFLDQIYSISMQTTC